MVAEAEVVCQQRVPVLDVQYYARENNIEDVVAISTSLSSPSFDPICASDTVSADSSGTQGVSFWFWFFVFCFFFLFYVCCCRDFILVKKDLSFICCTASLNRLIVEAKLNFVENWLNYSDRVRNNVGKGNLVRLNRS